MKKLSRRELQAYCGDISQVLHLRECTLQGGKAKGTKAYSLCNGNGLEMLVLPDKCFAIPRMVFQGTNIGFLSKAGICAPEFFQEEGTRGFLRNFEAGFLTTCGLTYMGTPGVEDGQANGLHGVISNTPMEQVSSDISWENDVAWLSIKGKAREGHLFGDYIQITREMRINSAENKLWIRDEVENLGFEKAPLMLLYHFNIGYPMLDACSRIYTNFNEVTARDPHSETGIENCDTFSAPVEGLEEEVFFRTMKEGNEEKEGYVLVHNPELEKAVCIRFDAGKLPILNEWKCPRAGDYAWGLEPGTSHVGGRIRAKSENKLMYIEPGETKVFEIEVAFIDCVHENDKLKAFIK